MVKYIDKGTARQHLTDRLMESALNNVGIKADADEVFRDIAENRLPVWLDELPATDVVEVVRCKECKHRREYHRPSEHYECELDTGNPYDLARNADNDEWFCADGERMDEVE